MILSIIGLKDHEPLIALECLLDVFYSGSQSLLALMLFLLDNGGAVIKRKEKEVHDKAQRDYRQSDVTQDRISEAEYRLKQQFQRSYQ